MKFIVVLVTLVAAASAMPAELFDEKAVDAVLEMPMQSTGFNLHFDVPEAFAELDSFLVQSAEVEVDAAIKPIDVGRVKFKDEPPILCETICRPMNETENREALNEAKAAELSAKKTEEMAEGTEKAALKAASGKPEAIDNPTFLQLSAKIGSRQDLSLFTKALLKASKNSVAVVIC